MLWGLIAGQCEFLGENRYGAGAVQKIDFTPVLLIRGIVDLE